MNADGKKRLADDCFALPAGVDWTPVDEALERLRTRLETVTSTEVVPLMQAAGRILAEPVTAKRSNPPAANAAVDGYAFAFDSAKAEASLPLVEARSAAGHPLGAPLAPGHACRILTGAEVPEGADTVVLQEDCEVSSDKVRFPRPKKHGANVRRAGEDAVAGDAVFSAGQVLNAADLARGAAVGLSEVSVRTKLRVAVLSTGDELIAPGAEGPGIFDANRPMLLALGSGMGAEVLDLGICKDNAQDVRASLDRAAQEADALITTGGASAGDEDYISQLLSDKGQISTWRVAVKPGRPLALGTWQGLPVFGLPGNPVAALVCSLIFVRPALMALAGAGWVEPQAFTVPAAFQKSKKPGRREYLRARVRDGQAEIFHSEGSGLVGGLSWADGLVELPDGAAEISPGDPVRYLPFSSFGL
ncbi:MAG: gephyrin-like molybdotransferase Glp [Pseudomonadota bacterium]